MNISQAKELYTLISTVRHVKKTDCTHSPMEADRDGSVCLLAEGVRHGLYLREDVLDSKAEGLTVFPELFGCTEEESEDVIIMQLTTSTGEDHYQAGKELIQKYGLWDKVSNDLHSNTMSFSDIMLELKGVAA